MIEHPLFFGLRVVTSCTALLLSMICGARIPLYNGKDPLAPFLIVACSIFMMACWIMPGSFWW